MRRGGGGGGTPEAAARLLSETNGSTPSLLQEPQLLKCQSLRRLVVGNDKMQMPSHHQKTLLCWINFFWGWGGDWGWGGLHLRK